MSTIVVLLGAPGAGKGTQAVRLSQARSLPHISTGELLRDHLKRGTKLGSQAQKFMDAGDLVPDELVLDMLDERVNQPDCRDGYVLDGFPRTLPQARALERRVQEAEEFFVVNLDAADDTIVERAAGRLSCKKCGRIYHEKFSPPAKPSLCDSCQGELQRRADDRPEVVRERLRVYREKTEPLIRYYQEKGVLETIDGEQSPEEVFEDLDGLIPRRV